MAAVADKAYDGSRMTRAARAARTRRPGTMAGTLIESLTGCGARRATLTRRRAALATVATGVAGAAGWALAACSSATRDGGSAGAGPLPAAPETLVWSTFRGGAEGGRWRELQMQRF